MKILYLKSVGSTQNYLKELIRQNRVELPYAVVSDVQTDGIGSRGNSWTGMNGNLFLSFAIELEEVPDDLAIESSSIYFAYLLKETLEESDSKVWLKWPNDFYLEEKKIGGMITNVVRNTIICGVGLNLIAAPEGFEKLDVELDRDEMVKNFLKKVQKKISWKQVFSKYELEFYKNQKFFTHYKDLRISLDGASLQSDGSIIRNGERIYSLR